MGDPLLYRINRNIVRLGMRAYFKEIEVVGRSRAPDGGPVIFASNHPHSITDSLVLGLAAGRMLHFVAHSGLFRNRFKAWFMRSSGVIPVYRPKDVEGSSDKNLTMFSACYEILDDGGAIGIFPEGTSAEERRVQKLKTGTARIALGAEESAGWNLGLTLVPVGLNFESCSRFRSRVLVKFGEPIVAGQWRAEFEADPTETVNRMTALLQERLREQVVNVEQSEYETFVRDVENIFKDELLARDDLNIPGNSPSQRSQAVTAEIARCLNYFHERSPDVIWRLARQMKGYNAKRHVLKLRDNLLREQEGPLVRSELWRLVIGGIAGLPWALFGLVGNWLPFRLTGWIGGRLAPDRTKIHQVQFGVGAVLFLLWYAALLTFSFRVFGTAASIVAGVGLPLAGLFAREYFRYMKKRRRMLRFAGLEFKLGFRVQELRRERRQLVRNLDRAMQEYLRAIEEES